MLYLKYPLMNKYSLSCGLGNSILNTKFGMSYYCKKVWFSNVEKKYYLYITFIIIYAYINLLMFFNSLVLIDFLINIICCTYITILVRI